ncbi:hypothetical protein VULLAG_LOCUS14464 [Vulpes lagopus]
MEGARERDGSRECCWIHLPGAQNLPFVCSTEDSGVPSACPARPQPCGAAGSGRSGSPSASPCGAAGPHPGRPPQDGSGSRPCQLDSTPNSHHVAARPPPPGSTLGPPEPTG